MWRLYIFMITIYIQDWIYRAHGTCDTSVKIRSGRSLQVSSPDYPEDSPRRMHCFYDLKSHFNSGDVIHLRVLDVTLSCDDEENTLKVFDAFSTNPRYLGRICKGGIQTFASPKDRLYLVYETGKHDTALATSSSVLLSEIQTKSVIDRPGKGEKKGRAFRLQVTALPEFRQCFNYQAKVLLAEKKAKQFVSPYFPFEVAPNVHCRWLIKASPGRVVVLHILEASMRGSNDCRNFGLFIYDGKTTYDDKSLGVICDNQSDSEALVSYRSTGNFLLVVFSSSSHVLHSGGGVKLQYYSVLLDSSSGQKNQSLLYSLLGIFVALACFTALLVVFRFIVIPSRLKKASRMLDIAAAAQRPGVGDLPPPYSPSDTLASSTSFQDVYPTSPSSSSSPSAPARSTLSFLLSCMPRWSFSPWRSDRQNASTGASSPAAPVGIQITLPRGGTPAAATAANDYQELPFLSLRYRQDNLTNSIGVSGEASADCSSSVGEGVSATQRGNEKIEAEDVGDPTVWVEESEGQGFEPELRQAGESDRSSNDWEGGDEHTAVGFKRNHLSVSVSYHCRFSADSGFREGEEEEGNEGSKEEPVYCQISNSSPCVDLPSTSNAPQNGTEVVKSSTDIASKTDDSKILLPHAPDLIQSTSKDKNGTRNNIKMIPNNMAENFIEATKDMVKKVGSEEEGIGVTDDSQSVNKNGERGYSDIPQCQGTISRQKQEIPEERENLSSVSATRLCGQKLYRSSDEQGYEIALPVFRPNNNITALSNVEINVDKTKLVGSNSNQDSGDLVVQLYDHLDAKPTINEDVEYQVLDFQNKE
ncbi:tumor necrosis factor, alpha-induced protein 6 [Plakobranchus ocellatus]|uniref:Tumor necrosis factor, alpha-induced protein 6 n=1 Tax=Plakobranchus ocellatus TaxID=259542 RepID=A0AAV4DQL6_9GAST|nr:tumor necrosis factor, alpha-induced protein 6 [Plakobranchus ocellatus]